MTSIQEATYKKFNIPLPEKSDIVIENYIFHAFNMDKLENKEGKRTHFINCTFAELPNKFNYPCVFYDCSLIVSDCKKIDVEKYTYDFLSSTLEKEKETTKFSQYIIGKKGAKTMYYSNKITNIYVL